MPDKTKGWPPERRAAQAERIRAQKPWEHTTGPTTEAGKAAASRNAFKHGFDSEEMVNLKAVLRLQRKFVKLLKP